MSEEKEPKKSKAGFVIAALLGVALVFWLLSAAANSGSSSSRQNIPALTTYIVRYRVGGTAQEASITIENESGGTEQKTVDVPWSDAFEAEPGQFVYVSAQSQDDASRKISCEIQVNGVTLESAESDGRFVIATCSGSVR